MGVNMKLNKIIKLKNSKYKIYLDEECIITFDEVILENNLLYNKNIDKELYNKILSDTEYYDIYNKVVNYILKKRRSEKEIIKYLGKFDLDTNNVNKIINKLKNVNLINDLEYCRAFVNDKVYLSKNGINKIKIDLLEQNIPIEVIENELKNIDESIINEKLKKIILKKINSNKKYSDYHLTQKILNEMINLGYSKSKILKKITNNLTNNDDILKKEFDKLYNKLSRYFTADELENKLKQKLILKGFKADKVNKLIQEKTEI